MRHWLRFLWLCLATSAFAHAPAPRCYVPTIHGGVRGYAYDVKEHLASVTGAGNMTNRTFGNGTSQTLSWDGLGRLVSVIQRDSANNGYNWTATYDALGRRLRTTHTPVAANVAYPLQTLTIGSLYDPQVEFQELAVTLNPDLRNGPGAQRTWKVFGPDGDGRERQPSPGGFGSAGGVGGLEATIRESDGQTTTVINDVFGNVVGTVSGTNGLWNPARVSSYGPEPGYQALTLSASVPLVETLVWRTRRIDPTGYYWLGARYYDPVAGRMLSPDPLGHAASMSLYDLCNGDPLNRFDPDGRAVIEAWQQTQQNLIDRGGLWNNAEAYAISLGITALNAFSVGSFGRNDALVNRNLAGDISDGQLYAGMAFNSGAAAAAALTGGAVAPIAGRALVAAGSPAFMYIGSGAAAGLSSSTVDVAVRRAGYAASDIQYDGTVGSDMAYIGSSTLGGAVVGGVTYAAVRTGSGVVYQRADATGNVGDYYGQAQDAGRYAARQIEHANANPYARYNFEQVSSARAGDDLDFMGQFYINANGGAQTQDPLTPLSNEIRAMSDQRFADFLFDTTVLNGIGGTMGANTSRDSGYILSKH